jgi:4-diphosphocytidyl-2-C-methyl-D-erythritol kinase
MKLGAAAKVNLSLRILAREESGFHQLETLFCAIDFCDELELSPSSPGLRLLVHGPDLGPPEDNLIVRAAQAFCAATDIEPALEIVLHKVIPPGAGLGGGSSDAAATLLALNALHGKPLSHAALLDLAARLGSDVPFFLCGSSLALGWGRGARLLALPPLPSAPVLLVLSGYAVRTSDAYRALAEQRAIEPAPPAPAVQRLDALASWSGVTEIAHNDFETLIFDLHPQLGEIKTALLDHGAILALLSGSGSAMFAIFAGDDAAAAAAPLIEERFPGTRAIPTHTLA